MRKKSKQSPSFFKVLIMDFTTKLRIPPAFSRKYDIGKDVTLRISSGKTWNVKLEITEDEKYKFSEGWNKFVKDVGLKLGEFIVFWLVGKSMFDVSIYGITCCERKFPVDKFQDDEDDSGEEDDEVDYRNHNAPDLMCYKQSEAPKGGASNSDHLLEIRKSPLYFEICLKNHHRSRLTLGKRFWAAAGLIGRENVGLEYLPEHRYQSVVLDHRPDSYRLDLTVGWPKFRKENGLVLGRTYSFQFNPGEDVIQVQELQTK